MRIGLCHDARVLDHPGDAASAAGCDVLVFPELLDGGYAALKQRGGGHTPGDGFLDRLRRRSLRGGPVVVAGSVALAERGRTTNTTLVFSAGRIVHRYTKIHLFGPTGDPGLFSPGTTAGTFLLRSGRRRIRSGVVICYDVRFPELVRGLAFRGLRLLFVPARWPKVRDTAWRTLLRARALENQIFAVGCNATGAEGGRSYVFDPEGRSLFEGDLGKGTGIHLVDIDPEAIPRARRHHNNLREAVLLSPRTLPLRRGRGSRTYPRG